MRKDFIRDSDILTDLLYSDLMQKIDHSSINEYLQSIKHKINRKDFFNGLIEYVFEQKKTDVITALQHIAGNRWLLEPDKREIKTIGLFYTRLSNGGIERVISLLSYIFKNNGFNVVVITEDEPNNLDFPLAEGTVRTVLGKKTELMQRAERWIEILCENNVDVIIYNAWLNRNIVLDSMAIKSCGIPLVVHLHGDCSFIYDFKIDYLIPECIMYSLSDVVVALSDVDQAWWKSCGLRTEKVNNPCNFNPKTTIPSDLKSNNVLWVGRISPEKQYEDAFKIADLVHEKIHDFRLVVVGTTEVAEDFSNLKKKILNSKRSDYVILEDYKTDLETFYRNSSIFLSTSRKEGFNMSILESKVFGLPLVSYIRQCEYYYRYQKGSVFVEQNDYKKAAEEIIKLLTDRTLLKKLGNDAREDSAKILENDLGKKWSEIFNEALTWDESRDFSSRQPEINTAIRSISKEFREWTEYQQKEIEDYKENINKIYSSTTWKIGKMAVFIPRKIKQALRKLIKR